MAATTYEALIGKTTGEIIAEMTNGASLVNGKQTFDCIDEGKNDIDTMIDCCRVELAMHNIRGAAPYFFDRAAMLLNKAGQFELAAKICEIYLALEHEPYFFAHSPRVISIRKRLAKAQCKLAKALPASLK